jgi:hypothetical protein
MNKAVTAHSPALTVGTPRRSLRSLVAVLLIAMASLGATIGYIASDDSGTSTVANTQSSPTVGDPFEARTQPVQPLGGPSESAVATAISPQPSVSAPDESAIAAAVAQRGDVGPEAKFQALQDKLGSMTPQQRAEAFSR